MPVPSPTIAPVRPPAFLPRPPAASPAGRRSFLDGVRGLAALWVVLSHVWIIPCGLGARTNWLGPLANWTLYSHFAVDLFLVVSGFCLVLPVARGGRLAGGAGGFFGRRARRILPPFYAALGFSILAFLVIQAVSRKPVAVDWAAVAANALLVQDILPDLNTLNGPFWSIAVEWRIYFLFPAAVWLLTRHGKRAVLGAALALGAALTGVVLRFFPDMSLACPWYLLLFALGLCAGWLSAHRPRRGEALLCLAAGAASLGLLLAVARRHPITVYGGADFGAYLPILDPLAGIAAAAALLWVSRKPRRALLLSWGPLVRLGEGAYSLYLIHLPCLLLLNALVTRWEPGWRQPLPHVYALLGGLPLVFGAARLFYLAFEQPFLRRRNPYAADISRSSGRDACGGFAGRPNK